jgi:BirA family biotin operon repressor/biotin-[acetyl-CoA-carboxylase] ligase
VTERAHPGELPSDLADALQAVRSRLGRIGQRVLFFPTIGSTNDIAARLATASDAEGTIVIADAQSAGRGRRGRSWFSPPGAGLYVSVVLTPARAVIAPDRATLLLTLTAGVGLAEGVERATGLAPAIKWPNDLLVGHRKLAGILAEGVMTSRAPTRVHAVVLGYGINVAAAAFPPELTDRATALEIELGRGVDRALLCAETLAALAARYEDLLAGQFDVILDGWSQRSPASRGTRVSWETADGPRSGVTAGIDDTGALLVRIGERTERLVAGEVIWN